MMKNKDFIKYIIKKLKNCTFSMYRFRNNVYLNCYYKGFPGMSTPVFTVSVCTIVKK